MQIHFILVEPAVPENVGFSARAIKTMGFSSLRLVKPCDHLSSPAKKTAYASHDVLNKASVFEKFDNAIEDLDLTIGTTAKKRTARVDIYTPDQLLPLIRNKGKSVVNTGLIFGREESGLTKQEINQCDIISSVPLHTAYPSLNLAQSVMLYAYELSAINIRIHRNLQKKAPNRLQTELKTKSIDILQWLGVPEQPSLYQRMMDRMMQAGEDDMHLFLSFIKKLEQKRGPAK